MGDLKVLSDTSKCDSTDATIDPAKSSNQKRVCVFFTMNNNLSEPIHKKDAVSNGKDDCDVFSNKNLQNTDEQVSIAIFMYVLVLRVSFIY